MGQNVGQIALEIVGTAIGTYFGQPQLGFAAGALIGGAAFPTKIDGPHVKNLQAMNASYGTMLPFGYGNFRVAGTLIDQIPIVEAGTTSGKGGPSVTSYSYYGWFAVALCEGPITDIRRLWANGILIYDVSDSATPGTIAASNQYRTAYLTIYKGDYTQNPDPTLQSFPQNGVGNTPAYRGTAYIVFRGIPLANFGNVEPAISAEIITSSVTNPLSKLWENDSTGFPMYSGSYPPPPSAVVGIPTGIGGGQVRIYNRNVSGGTIGGDGNTYILAASDGSVQSPDTPNSFESVIQTSDQVGAPKFNDGGGFGGDSLGLIMPHAAGNCGVYSLGVGTSANIATGPTRSSILGSGPAMWVEDYVTGTRQTDVIAALSTPPGLTGTWRLYAVFPCADWQHVCAVTYDAGNSNAWLHILSVSSSFAVAEIARYQFSPASAATAFDQVVGFFNTNGYAALANWDVAILESNLTTIWLVNGGSANLVSRYVISGSQVPAPQTIAAFTTNPGANMGIFADGGVCFVTDFSRYALFSVTTSITQVTLSSIVNDICQREGIAAGNIDTTALTDAVCGFMIDRQMTGRAALEALTPAWWFDGVESDTKAKFVKRSAAAVDTVTLDDMGAEVNGKVSAQPLVFTRGSEIELPTQINLTYYALASQYQQGMQYARRISTSQQNNIQSIDSAAVMDDTSAAVAAAIVLWDAIAGRTTFRFSTSYKWAQLEPTDIINLNSGAEMYLARLTRKTEAAGKIDWEAVGCAPVYSQSVAGGAITSVQPVSGQVATTAVIMDIPPLRDADGAGANLYVAMYGPTGWPGATLFKSSDSGITWVAGVSQGAASTVGKSTTALGDWLGNNLFDEGNTVNVQILSGNAPATMSSLPELSVLNGGNVGLLGNEIFQFKNAVLVSGTTYKLSGLLRGRFGTEWAATGHGIGETFVLLSPPGVIQIQPIPTADIGQPRLYQAVSAGQAVGSGAQQTITAKANTLVCFSPVLLNAGGAGYYNDIILTWTRRNRIHWQWLENVDEPMNEATESYLVSIFSGASVVRTFTVTGAQTVTYTLAQQITDFGGSGLTAITFGVQQISAVTGPGVMAKATITLPPKAYVPVTYTKTMTATQGSSASLSKGFITPKVMTATQASSASLSTTYIPAGGGSNILLLHLDGTNGSTTFTDYYGHAFTGHNGVALSTAQQKFGSASLLLTGSGNSIGGDTEISTPDIVALRGGSAFTIECWWRQSVVNGIVGALFSKRGSGSNYAGAFAGPLAANNKITVWATNSGSAWEFNPSGPVTSINTWYHFALVYDGINTITAYHDGTAFASNTSFGSAGLFDTGNQFVIGAGSQAADYGFNGYIDEFRYSPSVQYTSNFTPSGPFST